MTALSPVPHLCVTTLYNSEDVVCSLLVQTDSVLQKIFLKLRLLHISIPVGIHFAEHLLNTFLLLRRLQEIDLYVIYS